MKKKREKIPTKTVIEVLKRSKGRCEECGAITENPLHHIYFKSQYFGSDRNLSWNLAELCERHHRILHHSCTNQDIKDKFYLDYKLKKIALERYHGENKIKLEYELNKSKYKYENYPNWKSTINK